MIFDSVAQTRTKVTWRDGSALHWRCYCDNANYVQRVTRALLSSMYQISTYLEPNYLYRLYLPNTSQEIGSISMIRGIIGGITSSNCINMKLNMPLVYVLPMDIREPCFEDLCLSNGSHEQTESIRYTSCHVGLPFVPICLILSSSATRLRDEAFYLASVVVLTLMITDIYLAELPSTKQEIMSYSPIEEIA